MNKPGEKLISIFIALTLLTSAFLIYNYSKDDFYKDTLGLTFILPFPSEHFEDSAAQPSIKDFIGSEACEACHKEIYDLWKSSTHAKAGGLPSKEIIIGKFDEKPLIFKDAVVIPSITENDEFIFTVQPEVGNRVILTVGAVVGGGHLEGGGTQSYFTKFPDGTLRMLPFDFIKQENIWFVQLRESNNWEPISGSISLNDLSHWPPYRILGSNTDYSNCQNCHGSQLQVEYKKDEKIYETTFQGLDINCESCHGPGRKHIDIVNSGDVYKSEDIGFEALSIQNKDESLQLCFQCHAVKDEVINGHLPGADLERYYSMKMAILGSSPYLVDGRVRAFAYQQNHLFSSCYLSGSMTCVDCHEPHSQDYRDIYGNALNGKFDNGQCLDCHPSKAASPESHSNHLPDSPGNLCTSCHMPFLQHQGLGSQLKFARSDHTIPIPRPGFDASIGIENACSKCHTDKTVDWLQKKTTEWYGEIKPHHISVKALMDAQNAYDIRKAASLLLPDSLTHTMADATGLLTFIKERLEPDMPDIHNDIIKRLKKMAESDDLDIKALSLMAIHLSAGNQPRIRKYLSDKIELLGDNTAAVQNRWSIGADFMGSTYSAHGEYGNAIAAYKKAIEVKPTDSIALSNLAAAYMKTDEVQTAIAVYEQVLTLEPDKHNIYAPLSRAYSLAGNKEKAIEVLEIGIERAPTNEHLFNMLVQLESLESNELK